MKEIWIEIDQKSPASEKAALLKIANEQVDAILKETQAHHQSTGDIQVLRSFDADAINRMKSEGKKIALRISIKGKDDENAAVNAANLLTDYIIINCLDWQVIPLENLIARTSGKSKLIAEVSSVEDARLVLKTLQLGTDGVLFQAPNADDLRKVVALVKNHLLEIELSPAKITDIKKINIGARVCVDTCDLMQPGEGMLVGLQAAGYFFVEAEVHENPYVQSRPFRVNAGSLSMYTLAPLQNTRYLSELKAGDEVLIVNREGKTRNASVGRVKIELRPLILLEAEVKGKKIKTILQNAVSIRLVASKGSKAVTELKAGDEVLTHLAKSGGRHFGIAVPEETVIER